MTEFTLNYINERAHVHTLYAILKDVSRLMPDHAFSHYRRKYRELKERNLADARCLCERIQFMVYQRNSTMALPEPFPSAPQRPTQYEIKIKREDGGFSVMTTCEVYPMRKFLDLLIGGREWNWINDSTIRCHDMIIKSRHLKRFMTTILTPEEEAWILPLPYNYYARQIGHHESYSEAMKALRIDPGHDTQNPKQGKTGRTSRSERRKNGRSAAKQPISANTGPVVKPTGTTFGISELASATNLEPSKVRGILRKKATKPACGWEWPTTEFQNILALIQNNR